MFFITRNYVAILLNLHLQIYFISKNTLKKLDTFLDPLICHILSHFGKKKAQQHKTIELLNLLFLLIL
jgi:hypothetical protein